jgi:S-(hydroxymethyl)glutathione dehydrogenase/alcohol dehydrogenase
LKIKAAVLREFKAPLSIEELELADPKEHEVQIKMLATGLCHSDMAFWDHSLNTVLPQVLGHEACGVVERVGPGVTKVKPGDRVVGVWVAPCGNCYQCLRGNVVICEGPSWGHFGNAVLLDGTSRLTDKNGKPVGMAEFIAGFATHSVLPEVCAIKVPDHIKLPPEQLSQLGCSVLTGWGAVVNVAQANEETTVGIWGCGGIGLNTIRNAALRNCYPIMAVDIKDSKRDVALEFGATHFVNCTKEDPVEVAKKLTGGLGLNLVMEAIGDTGAQLQAWWALRSGGKMVCIGLTPEGSETKLPLTFLPVHIKTIRGCLYGDSHPAEDVPIMAELMNKGLLKTDKLISRTIKLEQINEAGDAMRSHDIIGRWVIKYD